MIRLASKVAAAAAIAIGSSWSPTTALSPNVTPWRGALPPSRCDEFPAFPYKFVNSTAYVQAHLQPATRERAHHCHTGARP